MDLDNDGNNDILSGSYSRMDREMAGLFQVLWGKPDGTFKKAETLKGKDGEPLIIPVAGDNWVENICTRPTAVDWDADGDLDLVVGNFSGTFYLFDGEGDGQFAPKASMLMAASQSRLTWNSVIANASKIIAAPQSGQNWESLISRSTPEALRITGVHSDPFPVDWDADGDIDLLSGSSKGGVQWAENLAGPGSVPLLAKFETLIDPGPQAAAGYGEPLSEDELEAPAGSTRVWVDDVNEDGKLDVLVGDNVALVAPAPRISLESFKEKFAKWQAEIAEVSAAMNVEGIIDEQQAAKQQEAVQRLQELYNSRTDFMQEDRTGFVWLYLQK